MYEIRELQLEGGRTTTGVVRVGDTVRRPLNENSEFVHKLLTELAKNNFKRCPRFLGIDEIGREILSYIEGSVPDDLGDFTYEQIRCGATILNELHDISSKLMLRGTEAVICHGDASPCNFVFENNLPIALIDFDAAFAGPREIDIGYSAWLWSNLGSNHQTVEGVVMKLNAFLGGYPDCDAEQLVTFIIRSQDWLLSRLSPDTHATNISWAKDCQKWISLNGAALQERINDGIAS